MFAEKGKKVAQKQESLPKSAEKVCRKIYPESTNVTPVDLSVEQSQ
jgi:hypothetical protein